MGTNYMIPLFTWLAENENYFHKNLEYFPKSLEQDMLTMKINLMDDYMETDIEDIAQIKEEDEVKKT